MLIERMMKAKWMGENTNDCAFKITKAILRLDAHTWTQPMHSQSLDTSTDAATSNLFRRWRGSRRGVWMCSRRRQIDRRQWRNLCGSCARGWQMSVQRRLCMRY